MTTSADAAKERLKLAIAPQPVVRIDAYEVDTVVLLCPPYFEGGNEKHLADHLAANIKADNVIVLQYSHVHPRREAGFYDIDVWMNHQANLVSQYAANRFNLKGDVAVVAVDFWCPGLEQIFLMNQSFGVNATYVGWLHGATWVPGDLMAGQGYRPIAEEMEATWLGIYDCIWYASDFFIKGLPSSYTGAIQKVPEPFDPSPLWEKFGRKKDESRLKYDVLYTGRISEDRDPDMLARVLGRCVAASISVRVQLPSKAAAAEFEDAVLRYAVSNSLAKDPVTTGKFHEDVTELRRLLTVSGECLPDDEYHDLLSRCSAVFSTATQEGWGYGVLKAVACGAVPVLPDSAVYPELYPTGCLYRTGDEEAAFTLIQEALGHFDECTYPHHQFNALNISSRFTFRVGGAITKLGAVQSGSGLEWPHGIKDDEDDETWPDEPEPGELGAYATFLQQYPAVLAEHISFGEVADRIAIARVVATADYSRDHDMAKLTATLAALTRDLKALFGGLTEDDQEKALALLEGLVHANTKIWGLESAIRNAPALAGFDKESVRCEGELTDVGIGERTRHIREFNRTRVNLKNELTSLERGPLVPDWDTVFPGVSE
jgi:glycosyltransferase involved in cell wall biosynthesis